jgi:hypothetical protein
MTAIVALDPKIAATTGEACWLGGVAARLKLKMELSLSCLSPPGDLLMTCGQQQAVS